MILAGAPACVHPPDRPYTLTQPSVSVSECWQASHIGRRARTAFRRVAVNVAGSFGVQPTTVRRRPPSMQHLSHTSRTRARSLPVLFVSRIRQVFREVQVAPHKSKNRKWPKSVVFTFLSVARVRQDCRAQERHGRARSGEAAGRVQRGVAPPVPAAGSEPGAVAPDPVARALP